LVLETVKADVCIFKDGKYDYLLSDLSIGGMSIMEHFFYNYLIVKKKLPSYMRKPLKLITYGRGYNNASTSFLICIQGVKYNNRL